MNAASDRYLKKHMFAQADQALRKHSSLNKSVPPQDAPSGTASPVSEAFEYANQAIILQHITDCIQFDKYVMHLYVGHTAWHQEISYPLNVSVVLPASQTSVVRVQLWW